jgi:hypothetical protein
MGKKLKRFDVVEVTWHDSVAVTEPSWRKIKDELKSDKKYMIRQMTHKSVGFIVKLTKEYLSITLSYRPFTFEKNNNFIGTTITIPLGCIKEIRKL